MPAGIAAFQSQRLVQAREARGLTAVALADLVGVSPATISQYENGNQKPRQDTLDAVARSLNVPAELFLRPFGLEKPARLFYRSMSSATKTARDRAEARYEWFLETLDYLLGFFDFPAVNLPTFDVPADFRNITESMIERWAQELRAHWGVGPGPIANVVQLLEHNGIIVWRTLLNADTLDAFSEYREPHPIVVLAADKANYFRSRMDATHELGHLIMHRHIDRKVLTKASDFKILENQAHYFGGSFLLPAKSFQKDLWALSLDCFRSLKPRWNASMGLQIHRCHDLGLLTEEQQKRLWINRSRRGWHRSEPLDDSTPVEMPTLMSKGFAMLIESRVCSKEQVVRDMGLAARDVESVAGLPEGFLSGQAADGAPTFKPERGKVVPFRRV